MNKTIHVLNGDAIVPIFNNAEIKGDRVIWREMLCDGPLDSTVASDEFWKKRYAFFEEKYEIQKLDYFDKTIKELLKVEDLANYDELVMWFEYDLFCQVNLMALCSFLLQNYRKDVLYYLVCVGKVKGKESFQSLSDFSAKEYQTLYTNKIKITRSNLLFMDQCWKLYVNNNYDALKDFNFNKYSKFRYLQGAINQHLKRFPNKKGIHEIEETLLKLINEKPYTATEIVAKMLEWQKLNTVYGFGDLQYFTYLKELNNYYNIKNNKYYLNKLGSSLISEE